MRQTKQIIFNVGKEEYGIDILKVHEIEKTTSLVRIPNAPSCVLGIMNLRGEVIPVYSLRDKFNVVNVDVNKDMQQLIITAIDNVKIGLLVDEVKEIVEIRSSQLHETPRIVLSEDTDYISAVACIDKQIILLLDVDAIINGKELEDINAMLEDVDEE